ncbi:hypothetical protein MZO42_00205 [Sphingomonas psychrotolerans]|uniref:Uncharacterized protein n=1 Tax=Sphingomonas psychrotolerans TaxID=1327635 RepID=A0ABU3MXQ5_9SPHN|nr:hypothetical protein [Sphingomonas psychrotolerans]MDT8757107.1 hypothetical protein [Sphingomonas psychrotolerans]
MRVPPLVWGASAGLLVAALLASPTGKALDELAETRAARWKLAQAAALPEHRSPLAASGVALAAPDVAAGRAVMMARLQRLAKAGGVLVEETSAIEATDGLVALRVRVSGAEKAVIALADAFEREAPLMRFRRWSLEPVAGGVRLSAEAVAVQ